MHHSPLIIDFYFVKKVHFELKEGFDLKFDQDIQAETPNLNIFVESGKHTEQPNQWKFELRVESEDKTSSNDFPYTFGVTLVGYFRVHEDFPPESADLLAQVNAPSVLYSAAREFLASVTGRSPYKAILLPSVSFAPVPNKENEKKETSKKKKKSSK